MSSSNRSSSLSFTRLLSKVYLYSTTNVTSCPLGIYYGFQFSVIFNGFLEIPECAHKKVDLVVSCSKCVDEREQSNQSITEKSHGRNSRCSQKPGVVSEPPGTGVTGSCEVPNLSDGNQTWTFLFTTSHGVSLHSAIFTGHSDKDLKNLDISLAQLAFNSPTKL
ncbi:hypothetical protein STEG23_006078 [Scotinomys teguina]